MDKPADPATPFGEVYQSFLDDLALEGTKGLDDPSLLVQHRAVREVARDQRPPSDPRLARADAPHRVAPAPGDPASAAARLDPAAPRRADEPAHRPLLPAQHQVPRVVAEECR